MVRIRSDRWYSGENQKDLRRLAPSNSGGTRRLISLMFLLALVLVLMAKLSDPKVIRQMFQALGVPMEQEVVATTHPDSVSPAPQAAVSQAASTTNSAWDKTCLDLIPRLLDKASPQQIDQLAEFWFATGDSHTKSKRVTAKLDLDAAPTIADLRKKLEGKSDSSQQWSDLLTNFESRWQQCLLESNLFHDAEREEWPEQSKKLKDEFHQRLSEYLDRRLLENLKSGSPWSPQELVGFGRLLQKGKEYQFGNIDPPLVTTNQLQGDFANLHGSWVRFRATVRLVESVDREQPLVDQASYSVLWLRGVDGAVQPIPVYTTSSIANQLKQALSPNNFPEVAVIGLVGKKLAYGSGSGVEVSPTLFAGSIIQFAPDLVDQLAPKEGAMARQFGIAGIATLVFGLFAFMFVWKQLKPKGNSTARRVFKLPLILALIAPTALISGIAWAQEPPWKDAQTDDDIKLQVVQQRLSGSFSDQEVQQIQQLIDGEETIVANSILKALFAINQVGWNSAWQTKSSIPVSSGYVLKPIELVGMARSAQALPLALNQQEWFSAQPIKQIYRIQVQLAENTDPQSTKLTTVFCRAVPKLWRESVELKQPIQLRCYSLSSQADTSDSLKPLCCLAEQVIWKMSPTDILQSTEFRPTLSANWLELARSDWDLSWFDLLASNSQKRLIIEEAEPLLKLLEITQQATSTSVGGAKKTTLVQPIDCMKKPTEHIAAPIDWQVRLVTGSVVELPRKDDKVKYYQFDGFVKIPNQTVNYTIPDTGQSITFENEFPVTIVTYFDDQFVPHDKLALGERTWPVGKMARIQGRFIRLWSYESQRLSTAETNSRQIAPLIAAGLISESNTLPKVSQRSLWSVVLLGCAMLSVMAWVLRDFLKKSTRPQRSDLKR